jgi:hypothetical protein
MALYNWKKIIIFFIIPLLIFIGVCLLLIYNSIINNPSSFKGIFFENIVKETNIFELQKGNLTINNINIKIEIAANDLQRYRGLSGRDSLCDNCGMYFIFPAKSKLEFVMRDMNFPLDIIFINDNKIINIAANLKPEGTKISNIYSSTGEANRVLELKAGECERLGIKVGDLVIAE